MKILRYFFCLLVLAFCVFFGACSESTTTVPGETYKGGECYDAPGCVVVAFDKNVTDGSIQDFISDLGLMTQGDIFGATEKWVIVAVPEGTEDEWIVALSDYEIVVTVERNQICPVNE